MPDIFGLHVNQAGNPEQPDDRDRACIGLRDQEPAMMIDSMYAELIELNESIHSREPGKRFATREEADIRRKLLLGIRSIQQQQGAGSHMEVLLNFIEYIKGVAPGLTRGVTLLADSYLTGEKRLGTVDTTFIVPRP